MTAVDPLTQARQIIDTHADDIKALHAYNFVRMLTNQPILSEDDVDFIDGPHGMRSIHAKNCDCGHNTPKPVPASSPAPVKLPKQFALRLVLSRVWDVLRRS